MRCMIAARESWDFCAVRLGQSLQLAVLRMLLAGTWTGMVRHQKLDQSFACSHHVWRVGLHHHSRFGLANTRGSENASAYINHANAAYTHRRFVLLMAKSGDRNAMHPRRIEDADPLRDRDCFPVDRQLDGIDDGGDLHAAPARKQTSAGQRLCTM